MSADRRERRIALIHKSLSVLIGAAAGRGVSLIGALLLALALGRTVGAAGLGLFALCQSGLSILSVFGRIGLDRTVTRYVGGLPADEVIARQTRVSRTMGYVLATNIVLAAVAYGTFWLVLPGARYAILLDIVPIFCAVIPVYSVQMILNGYFKGVRRPGLAAAMELGSASFGAAALIAAFTMLGHNVTLFEAALFFAGSSVATLTGGFILFARLPLERSLKNAAATGETDFFLETSFPFMLITLVPFLNQFTPLVVSSVMLSANGAGLFRVSERATLIISGPLLILSAILPPYILKLYRGGRLAEIRSLVCRICIWTGSGGVVLLTGCLIFRSHILALFGPDFRTAGSAFAIMAVGQFINLASGPVGLTLMMIKKEKWVRDVNVTIAIVGIVFYPIAFGARGLIGGATLYSLLLLGQSATLIMLVLASTRSPASRNSPTLVTKRNATDA